MSGNLLIHVFRSSIIDLHGFPLQTRIAWFSAAICKHVYFETRTANMCDFLLQREQDAVLPLILSHPMFLREIGSRQTQKRAALSFGFGLAGPVGRRLFSFQCISEKTVQQIRMHFPAENHPSWTFPANQDAFPHRKSSLPDISSKSGCISPTGIISPGNFQQIRMHFSDGNHPSRKFSADQDAFLQRESSLPDISSKSGSISPPEIIPHRLFQQIKMHFPAGNHPSKTFLANQDQFLRWKSSPTDISC